MKNHWNSIGNPGIPWISLGKHSIPTGNGRKVVGNAPITLGHHSWQDIRQLARLGRRDLAGFHDSELSGASKFEISEISDVSGGGEARLGFFAHIFCQFKSSNKSGFIAIAIKVVLLLQKNQAGHSGSCWTLHFAVPSAGGSHLPGFSVSLKPLLLVF